MSDRVKALVARRDELDKEFKRMGTDGEMMAVERKAEALRREARAIRPRNEAELRALENAGFLDPAPQNIAEGDSSFRLLSNARPLNFDSDGHRWANRLSSAGPSSHDCYGTNSEP